MNEKETLLDGFIEPSKSQGNLKITIDNTTIRPSKLVLALSGLRIGDRVDVLINEKNNQLSISPNKSGVLIGTSGTISCVRALEALGYKRPHKSFYITKESIEIHKEHKIIIITFPDKDKDKNE